MRSPLSLLATISIAIAVFLVSWRVDLTVGGFLVFRMLILAAVPILLLHLFSHGRLTITRLEVLALMFWTWGAISLMWGRDPAMTYSLLAAYITGFVLMWATTRLGQNLNAWRLMGWSYLAGCAVASYFMITGGLDFAAHGVGAARATVGDLNANYVSYAIATSIPIALVLLQQSGHSLLMRLFIAGYVALSTAASLFSGSRGALVAIAACIGFFFLRWARRRLFSSLVVIALAVSTVYIVFDFIPEHVQDRLSVLVLMISSRDQVDMTGRDQIWPVALSLFDSNPLVGAGLGSFPSYNVQNLYAHNVILSLASEVGIVGLLLYFTLIFSITRKMLAGPQKSGAVMLLLVWVPICMTGAWEFAAPAWFAFGWMMAAKHAPSAVTSGQAQLASSRRALQAAGVD
jgi:O-antigen ligase